MGYDMYAKDPVGNRDEDYFRLNIWGMGDTRTVMHDLDLLEVGSEHTPFPDHPGGEWVDEEDVVPGTPWATYYEETNKVLAEHPISDDPRLPIWKLCSNDGWHVTAIECKALATMARDGRADGKDLPEWWADWIDFIARCGERDGFRVH